MSAKLTAILAVPITAYCAGILGAFTTTPEPISQIIVGAGALIFSGLVVFGLWLVPSFQSCAIARQRAVIWITASSTSAIVCLFPLVLYLLRR
jgi:hypothetical protein